VVVAGISALGCCKYESREKNTRELKENDDEDDIYKANETNKTEYKED